MVLVIESWEVHWQEELLAESSRSVLAFLLVPLHFAVKAKQRIAARETRAIGCPVV
jgi:hypothetical protein